jgi:hypothetical protein
MDPYNGLVAKMAMVEVVKFLTDYRPVSVLATLIDLDTASWKLSVHDLEA